MELSDGYEDLKCRITNWHIESTFGTAIHSDGTVLATMWSVGGKGLVGGTDDNKWWNEKWL